MIGRMGCVLIGVTLLLFLIRNWVLKTRVVREGQPGVAGILQELPDSNTPGLLMQMLWQNWQNLFSER